MAGRVAGDSEAAGEAAVRVTVDAIGADLGEQTGDSFRERARFGARPLVPRHVGEEHADTPAVQVVDHFLKSRQAAGHVAQQVELVAVVDAEVGVHGP